MTISLIFMLSFSVFVVHVKKKRLPNKHVIFNQILFSEKQESSTDFDLKEGSSGKSHLQLVYFSSTIM